MVSNKTTQNECDATCRMDKLLNELSLEEQRILARLSNQWEKKEQRRYPRINCSIVTEYLALEQHFKEIIKNISVGGAYVYTKKHFPLNIRIYQSFFIPNTEILIRSNSQIIWTGPEGFGVRFDIIESKNPRLM